MCYFKKEDDFSKKENSINNELLDSLLKEKNEVILFFKKTKKILKFLKSANGYTVIGFKMNSPLKPQIDNFNKSYSWELYGDLKYSIIAGLLETYEGTCGFTVINDENELYNIYVGIYEDNLNFFKRLKKDDKVSFVDITDPLNDKFYAKVTRRLEIEGAYYVELVYSNYQNNFTETPELVPISTGVFSRLINKREINDLDLLSELEKLSFNK
jgi:cold shock CspA family protein